MNEGVEIGELEVPDVLNMALKIPLENETATTPQQIVDKISSIIGIQLEYLDDWDL